MRNLRTFIMIMALCSITLFSCSGKPSVRPIEKKPVAKTGTIAVMNFDSLNTGADLAVAVGEIVRSEISVMDDIPYTVIERIMLNKVLQEQALSMTGILKTNDASRVGKLLYAENLVFGKIMKAGENYRISASIVATDTGIVKKQIIKDIASIDDISLAAKEISFRLFDKDFTAIQPRHHDTGINGKTYTSIYTDSRGIHQGGKIYLTVKGNSVSGYTIEDIGRAEMSGSVSDGFINGYYRAPYGYGNFTFRIAEGGKYLIGNYYAISNRANGDWIASAGETFELPDELYLAKWKPGNRCLVRWSGDGYWYPASIGKIQGKLYFINYADGDKEWRLEKYIREENLKPGDIVFGNYKAKGRYYRGKIAQRSGDKLFIHYDDGDKEWTSIGKVRCRLD